MTTLDNIREYMINSLSHYNPIINNDENEDNEGYYDDFPYDEDGYCSDSLWIQIQGFWEHFETDKDFEYVVSCKFMSDEFDLYGGRSYLLNDDEIIDMLFDYMYNTLKWSKSDYKKIIFNTSDLTDSLEEKYSELNENVENNKIHETNITSKSIFENINFKTKKIEYKFDFIPHVIKYPKSRKNEIDSCESLEFLSNSKVDKNFICYKIKKLGVKIPSGYEVIEPIENLFN